MSHHSLSLLVTCYSIVNLLNHNKGEVDLTLPFNNYVHKILSPVKELIKLLPCDEEVRGLSFGN